ncbi:hypothetical protein C8T65DRAFT_729730 [Cerioporus squamosus]|nr:hypothetical protein C8T65DRAFT_729730 [Cerioporus squamosus]
MSILTELPDVPLEVAENVIDQLSRDIESLRSCALTCHGWLPRARYHLVASIRVRSREDLYSICDYFRFNPRMATLVRNLSVSPEEDEEALLLLETIPVALLSRLPKLRSYGILGAYELTVRAISFHATTLIHIKTCLHVEELTLQLLSFRTTAELARLLIALPQLRRLDCTRLRFPDESKTTGGAVTGITRFRDKCKCLSDVTIENSNLLAVRLITQMSLSSLEFLRCDLDRIMFFAKSGDIALDLSELKRLRSLEIIARKDKVFLIPKLPGDPVHSASCPVAFPSLEVVLDDSESYSKPVTMYTIWRMVDSALAYEEHNWTYRCTELDLQPSSCASLVGDDQLVMGFSDGTLRWWDIFVFPLATTEPHGTLTLHPGESYPDSPEVTCLSVSPHQSFLLVASAGIDLHTAKVGLPSGLLVRSQAREVCNDCDSGGTYLCLCPSSAFVHPVCFLIFRAPSAGARAYAGSADASFRNRS